MSLNCNGVRLSTQFLPGSQLGQLFCKDQEQYGEIVYSGVSTLFLEFRKPIRPSKVQKEIELIISIHYDNLGLIQSYIMQSMELRRK